MRAKPAMLVSSEPLDSGCGDRTTLKCDNASLDATWAPPKNAPPRYQKSALPLARGLTTTEKRLTKRVASRKAPWLARWGRWCFWAAGDGAPGL